MKLLKSIFFNAGFVYLSAVILVFFPRKCTGGIHKAVRFSNRRYFTPFRLFSCCGQLAGFVYSALSTFLTAALFGLITEGVLTIIYEGGLFNPSTFAYTALGWHSFISAMFGWYFLRKLLLQRNLLAIIGWSGLAGIFWGYGRWYIGCRKI